MKSDLLSAILILVHINYFSLDFLKFLFKSNSFFFLLLSKDSFHAILFFPQNY